jgi:hypothetical protein
MGLDTIQLITKNLTARFSSHAAQSFLVQHIGTFIRNSVDAPADTEREGGTADTDAEDLQDDPIEPNSIFSEFESVQAEPIDYIINMIQILFNILGTIANPTCIDNAKKIVQAVYDALSMLFGRCDLLSMQITHCIN